ncbi:MAG: IS5 family transposase, partial [Candidatus Competibacteraceae bacterium]|nr:IS5 family transposase [Candidatus Competibacteraceae bacterium]
MKPKSSCSDPQDDLFKVRLSDLVNPEHKLCRLARLIDWQQLEQAIEPHFGEVGAPALPVRLMVGLLYLQHTYGVSDEAVVDQWVDSPYWQLFCGETFFQHRFPCHPTSLVKWRQRLGEAGGEELLAATVQAGLRSRVITPTSLKRVVVDTTVQEKNIAFPTDSRLYDGARRQLVQLAGDLDIPLRQTYRKACRELLPRIGRYGHAKQYRRLRKAVKTVKGYLGRVYRDVLRQLPALDTLTDTQRTVLVHARRLLEQHRHSKNKLYSLHAPEVECISKGKAHKRYEFGVKASFATTVKEAFVVGARSFTGNPYDGHTLSEQLEQVSILCDQAPQEAYVDRGYKGHQHPGDTQVFIAGQQRGITARQRKRLNRRNTIEPIIGHMKADGKLGRC